MLPREMGCDSGVTCWRRLKGVAAAREAHRAMLERLAEADQADWGALGPPGGCGLAQPAGERGGRHRTESDG